MYGMLYLPYSNIKAIYRNSTQYLVNVVNFNGEENILLAALYKVGYYITHQRINVFSVCFFRFRFSSVCDYSLTKKSSELNSECSLTNLFWWKCFIKQIIIIKKIENSITHWQKWLRNQTHLKCMLHVKHWKRIHFTLKRRANAFIIIKNIAQHFCTGVMLWICDTAHIKWEYQIRIQVLFKLPFSFCAYLRLLYSTNTEKEREIKKCSLNSLCLNNCTGK